MVKEPSNPSCGCGTKFHNYSVGVLACVFIALMLVIIIGSIFVLPTLIASIASLGDAFNNFTFPGGP